MKNRILDSAKIMGVPLTDEQADKMVKYHEMLVSANKQMNLTRVPDDINEAADRNYLDSLNAVKHLEGVSALIDVGTGAGFPGIPIAIACPHIGQKTGISRRVRCCHRSGGSRNERIMRMAVALCKG